jgi:hypothetical protein
MTILKHRRYLFDQWIAAGGMGEVWRATDTLLEREVAVKVLRRDLAADPLLRSRFAAEARHAGSLQHPNVASVLDYGEVAVDGQPPLPFLVMELVDGEPLSAMLAGGQVLAPHTAAELIAQAADGIEAAHAIGIVHRDVKPGNLLVTPEGQVKVTDFGVARAKDTASLTLTGHLIGTPHYLSPEQAEGASATPASDVYALGIVLFECLAGRKPFTGESPVATALMQIREPLPDLPLDVPDRLQRIVRVATAKDPASRFRSAGAMASALRDETPDTRTYLLPDRGADAVHAVDDPAGGRRLAARPLLAGAAALLLLAGGTWALTASSQDQDGAPAAIGAVQEVETVRVRDSDHLGEPVHRVARELRRLGLQVRTAERKNPGGRTSGNVASVSPTGRLEPGDRVLLEVWGAPTATSAKPDGSSGQGTRSGSSAGGSGPDKGTRPGTSDRSGRGGRGDTVKGPGQSKGNGKSGSSNAGGSGRNSGGNGGGNSGGNPGKGKR